jgi:hypothetical protein
MLSTAGQVQAELAPPWYVGVNGGRTTMDASLDVTSGSLDLLFEPEDEGDTLGLEFGYSFDPDWFVSVEFQRVDADDTEIDNLFLTLNYRWPLGDAAAVYAGAIVGQSELSWQQAPIAVLNEEPESESLLWGLQAGASIDAGRRWRFSLRYQFLAPEHRTKLRPASGRGDFTHEQFHQLNAGVQFRF